jgi:Coenzyme PQQ synthesis protein D (PqqD)
MGRRPKREVNLLELVPQRIAEHETDEAGIVTVLMPRFRNRIMKRLIEPRHRSPFIRIKLDEIGSAVWLLCDGRRNVREIAEQLRDQFKEKIEPCNDRLGLFFRELENARFISFVNLEECLRVSGE